MSFEFVILMGSVAFATTFLQFRRQAGQMRLTSAVLIWALTLGVILAVVAVANFTTDQFVRSLG